MISKDTWYCTILVSATHATLGTGGWLILT
jgi:hypothetical protein